MDLLEAIEQAKVIRDNLKRVDLTFASKDIIDFRLKSIKALDVILKKLEECKCSSTA